MKLSIIVPIFNEGKTIFLSCERIGMVELMAGIEKEILIVNDASRDNTEDEVFRYRKTYPHVSLVYERHPVNRGKGAAIHTGISRATGDLILIQDADLEYDPQEYNLLLKPVVDGLADVVYGSRFLRGSNHRVLSFRHTAGNKFLTLLSNLFTDLNLSDMETCYKLFRADILKSIPLRERRFGFEPEVTAKISRIRGISVYETAISYNARTYQEGKKIGWKDACRAIYCILRYNLFHDR